MTLTRTFGLATTAAALASVALAGAASAAPTTYCVNAPACSGTPEPNLQLALSVAQGTPDADRIEIGPSSQSEPVDGTFSYTGSPTNTVSIVGAGTTQTYLTPSHPDVSVLLLRYGDVSDLHIESSPLQADTPSAIGLDIAHGTGTRLSLASEATTGAKLGDSGTLRDSVVDAGGSNLVSQGVRATGPNALVADTTINGAVGVQAQAGGDLKVVRSRISATIGAGAVNGGSLRVEDSLIHGSQLNTGVQANAITGDVSIQLVNDTIVGSKNGTPDGVASLSNGAGRFATVSVQNTAISGVTRSLDRNATQGLAGIFVSHSAFDPSTVISQGFGSLEISDANLGAPTGFVDAAGGDFRLQPGSPLVDAGSATPGGGLSERDLAGAPRNVDGNGDGSAVPDIGAFEYLPPAPVTDVPGPSGPAAPPTVPGGGGAPAVTPVLSGLSLSRKTFSVGHASTARSAKAGTAFRFSLNEAATVRIRIDRSGKPVRGQGTPVRRAKAGPNRVAFSGRIGRRALKPGRYVARVTATDPAGRKSATRSVRFKVVKR